MTDIPVTDVPVTDVPVTDVPVIDVPVIDVPVTEAGATRAVHFYWRPGCPFCMMLRRGLAKIGIETIEHNIWDEPADAAVVRSYANGNETVPTVVIGDVGMVNPSASTVAAHLANFGVEP